MPEVFAVEITPESYRTIHALARQSHRPVPELLAMAINLFNASARNLRMMNSPCLTPSPLTPDKRAAAIKSSVSRKKHPVSVGQILKNLIVEERNPHQ